MSINSAPVQDGIIVQANLKIKNDVYSFDFDFNEKKPNLTVKLTMPSRNGKSKTYEFGINKKNDGLVYYANLYDGKLPIRFEMFENIWKFNLNNKQCQWACENPLKFEFVVTGKEGNYIDKTTVKFDKNDNNLQLRYESIRNGETKNFMELNAQITYNDDEYGLGMISHKKSQITFFGHKHKIKNFIYKFGFLKKNSTAIDFGSYFVPNC